MKSKEEDYKKAFELLLEALRDKEYLLDKLKEREIRLLSIINEMEKTKRGLIEELSREMLMKKGN